MCNILIYHVYIQVKVLAQKDFIILQKMRKYLYFHNKILSEDIQNLKYSSHAKNYNERKKLHTKNPHRKKLSNYVINRKLRRKFYINKSDISFDGKFTFESRGLNKNYIEIHPSLSRPAVI